MSTHANQHDGTPTSSRTKIRGANPTYKSSVQKEERDSSSTAHSPAGDGKRKKDLSVDGASRTTETTKVEESLGGYGSGHYKPNK